MRKSFAYFFLSCSLLLVLGHSALPHDHNDYEEFATCKINTEKNLSLAEIVKLALANNLGANHLEEFRNGEKPYFSHEKNTTIVLLSEIVEVKKVVLFPQVLSGAYSPEYPSSIELIHTDSPLRAPPPNF